MGERGREGGSEGRREGGREGWRGRSEGGRERGVRERGTSLYFCRKKEPSPAPDEASKEIEPATSTEVGVVKEESSDKAPAIPGEKLLHLTARLKGVAVTVSDFHGDLLVTNLSGMSACLSTCLFVCLYVCIVYSVRAQYFHWNANLEIIYFFKTGPYMVQCELVKM